MSLSTKFWRWSETMGNKGVLRPCQELRDVEWAGQGRRDLGTSLNSATDSSDLGQCLSPSGHCFLNCGIRAFVVLAPHFSN